MYNINLHRYAPTPTFTLLGKSSFKYAYGKKDELYIRAIVNNIAIAKRYVHIICSYLIFISYAHLTSVRPMIGSGGACGNFAQGDDLVVSLEKSRRVGVDV